MNNIINKVINADWRDKINIIDNNSIDMLLTDPPYGMNFQSNHRKQKHSAIKDDDNLDWLNDWLVEIKRVMKEDAHLYIFCSWHNIDIFKQKISKFFNVKNILIWEKNNTGMGDLYGDYAPKYEMILFCSNGVKKLNGRRDANILKATRTQNENHPTQKPVNLLEYLIEKSTNKDDLVLDTFAGSFSTAQACKKIDRNFICIEIEQEYCVKAEKVLSGVTKSFF
jgi:site-specific DNA-methyltransferase (adenine-specific)